MSDDREGAIDIVRIFFGEESEFATVEGDSP